MLLSETFKQRLKVLAGVPTSENLISEGDKRNVIITKIKFPEELQKEIADWAHNLSDKYSIWIADSLKKTLIQIGYIDENGELDTGVQKSEKDGNLSPQRRNVIEEIRKAIKAFTPEYEHILDWLRNRTVLAPEQDQLNLKALTFQQATLRSKAWHEALKDIQGGKIQDEDGEIVMNFPDGFYWIKLGRAKCEKEAAAMGHCGSGRGMLYSLRKDQYPYITTDVSESGVVLQMKGRANTKPKAEFHKYIIPFILGDNPNVNYFHSTYQPHTDFRLEDLNDIELKNVVLKKPSLLKHQMGVLKRLSLEDIKMLLLKYPDIFKYENISDNLILSDVLQNEDMVNWALDNAPKLFWVQNWGTVKFNQEQLKKALSKKEVSEGIFLDQMNLDKDTLNWVVKNRPEMFATSKHILEYLSDEQKDYLVKHYPKAFTHYISMLEYNDVKNDKEILQLLGPDRLRALFISNPELFSRRSRISYIVFNAFLTPELLSNYIRNHSKDNDPFGILSSVPDLNQLAPHFDADLGLFFIQHYPMEFYGAQLLEKTKEEGWEKVGRYIVDHHLDWIKQYSEYNKKLNIHNWNLTPIQKQKIVNAEIQGKLNILSLYSHEEMEKINFSPAQKNELISSKEVLNNLTFDTIQGLKLSPEKTQELIIYLFENNNNDESYQLTLAKEIEEVLGEQYVFEIYKQHPEFFNALIYPVRFKDIERLKKYNGVYTTYTDESIKLRFDDWQDSDLLDFFDDNAREGGKDIAKSIANYELDFHSYDYTFESIDNNFSDLDQINSARVKYLIKKAFPPGFKKQIQAMTNSQLVDVLNNPEEFAEGGYNDSLLDDIKTTFVRAVEDAQRQADEDEYWKLFIRPISELLGKSEWANVKTKKKGEEKIEDKQMLEFEISYKELVDFIKDAQSYGYYDDGFIDISSAGNLNNIIAYALDERGDRLTIKVPYYGVQGDFGKDELNERFSELLFENNEISTLLDKAKVIVKKEKK